MSRLDRFFALLDEVHRWLMEPGPGQYGPGLFDFEPDWTLRRVRDGDIPGERRF